MDDREQPFAPAHFAPFVPIKIEHDFKMLEEDIGYSQEPEVDFVLTFETLPELWDPTHSHYRNSNKRTEALKKLLPILRRLKPFANIRDVKKKINSIRSNHRRELRRISDSKKSGDGSDLYVPTVWYFPYLKFLRDIEQPRLYKQEQSGLEDISSQHSEEASLDETSFPTIAKISPHPSSSKLKTSVKLEDDRDPLKDEIPYEFKPHIRPCESQNSNHLLMEWANTLESLDPLQRIYAKKAINDILFEAELGNLNKDSVKINELNPN